MDYSALNLREKTFLDFTTDRSIIEEIIGDEADVAYFLNDPDENSNRMLTFMEFSDMTPDKQLAKAIVAEFGKEWDSVFNE